MSSVKKQKLLEEYRNEINQLENLSKAIYAGSVVKGENGTIDVKMSPNQLAELASAKEQIFKMKRQALAFEKEIEEEEDDV